MCVCMCVCVSLDVGVGVRDYYSIENCIRQLNIFSVEAVLTALFYNTDIKSFHRRDIIIMKHSRCAAMQGRPCAVLFI